MMKLFKNSNKLTKGQDIENFFVNKIDKNELNQ